MLEKIIAVLAGFIVGTIGATGLFGVVLMMAIESACIPLPSEIIMPFAGYLASLGHFSLVAAATAGAIGCNIGSLVAYEVGKHGGRPFVERWGGYFLVTKRDLDGPTASSPATAASRSSSAGCCPWCAPSSRCPPASPACRC